MLAHSWCMSERRSSPIPLAALSAASQAHIASHGAGAEFCPACIAYLAALGQHPQLPREAALG